MIQHSISLAFQQPKSALSYRSPETALADALSEAGLSLGNEVTGSEKGIYTWQINTPEGTPLETLRIGHDSRKKEYVLDDGETSERNADPKILLKSIRLSPTVALKTPAI